MLARLSIYNRDSGRWWLTREQMSGAQRARVSTPWVDTIGRAVCYPFCSSLSHNSYHAVAPGSFAEQLLRRVYGIGEQVTGLEVNHRAIVPLAMEDLLRCATTS